MGAQFIKNLINTETGLKKKTLLIKKLVLLNVMLLFPVIFQFYKTLKCFVRWPLSYHDQSPQNGQTHLKILQQMLHDFQRVFDHFVDNRQRFKQCFDKNFRDKIHMKLLFSLFFLGYFLGHVKLILCLV